jgi:hypothetical protein
LVSQEVKHGREFRDRRLRIETPVLSGVVLNRPVTNSGERLTQPTTQHSHGGVFW